MIKRILIIFFTAFILRACYVLIFPQTPVVSDAAGYDAIGWNVERGAGYSLDGVHQSAFRVPVYPLFLAAVYQVFGHNFVAVRLVQSAVDSLTCVLIFLLAFEIFDGITAFTAALLTACYPVLVAYCGLVLTETLFTMFFVASSYLFTLWQKNGKTANLVFSGILFGVSVLTKPTIVLFPIGLYLTAVLVNLKGERLVSSGMIFLLIFAATIAPWTIRNKIVFNKVIPFCTIQGNSFKLVMLMGGPTPEAQATLNKILMSGKDEFKVDEDIKSKIDELSLTTGRLKLAENIIKSVRFLPKFWVTSHSGAFQIDLPNRQYIEEKNYAALAFKTFLLVLQIAMLASCAAGIYLSRKNYKYTLPLVMIFLYFCLHLNNVGRYHVPVIPFMLIFSAVTVLKIFNIKNENNTDKPAV